MTLAAAAPSRRGLFVIFGSTFFELAGYFMLTPWLILRLTEQGAPTALIGVFAASAWVGILLVTPFASALTRALGRRPALWLSGAVPVLAGIGYGLPLEGSAALALWFGLKVLAGMASGLRWVLAEALVAEFAPAHLRGRAVGLFETMVGATFVIGPMLLAAVGPSSAAALWLSVALLAAGLVWAFFVPPLPPEADAHEARVGWRGVWTALRAHPVIMAAGFCGGFFESGLTAILPLYGLALGLGAAAAALLVSASGLGSSVLMLPAGALADRLGRQGGRRGGAGGARLQLMRGCAAITLLATLVIPWVAGTPWLAWPVAFLWGGAGGCLYTLAMIDIGARERGVTLVNSTAVLVMAYTLGGVLAPSLAGAALQWAPRMGFPALLLAVAVACLVLLARARAGHRL
ncbi:putative MFS-type transporter YcaD [Tepidimonas fonticaldi]|uniref:Putative MFS-type transporter YcaD n=1 Tax=Tepidimonas fonticaldi TaxID=1101373 RepID=A0A554XN03_9BURK|nr:MFS transporter [Tepidimonas fonticaldi]TSE37204.1 putative MFS-type transporter YcaD [Tepidimonas fonticaldi]